MDVDTKIKQLRAATFLSEICAKTQCSECQFAYDDLTCMLIGKVPESWAEALMPDHADDQ